MSAPVVKLVRGANASLTELVPMLGTVAIGFGWRLIDAKGPATELVPSAIICDERGMALSDEHLVFFNQLATPDGAVRYLEGDDEEQVEVNLAAVPENVDKIVFVVYADPDLRSPGNFAGVRRAYARVLDRSGTEIVRYELDEGSSADVTAMIFIELYRHRGTWKVRAIGQGYSSGLKGVASDFGIAI